MSSIVDDVSLDAVRVFDAAARRMSFKAAAAELHLTPSAVSHRVRRFEEQLGVSLFDREVRRVRLTEAGRRLFEGTRVAFEHLERALGQIVPGASEAEALTVSVTPAFAARWLVPRLPRFHRQHPEVQLRLSTSTTVVTFDTRGSVDAAIRYGGGPYPGLQHVPLLGERLVAVASPAYRRKTRSLRRATLLGLRWTNPRIQGLDWSAFFVAADLDPPDPRCQGATFDDESHMLLAALAGQGAALVSDVLVADELRLGSLVLMSKTTLPGLGYHLVARPGALDRPKARPFVDWLVRETRV